MKSRFLTRTKTRTTSIPVYICLLVLLCVNVSFSQIIEFKYDPSSEFNVVIDTLRIIKDMGIDSTHRRVDVSEIINKSTVSKDENGYSIKTEPISISTTRNGEPVDNPILSILKDTDFTVRTDLNGKALSIEGYEKMRKQFVNDFPVKVVEAVFPMFSDEYLIQKMNAELDGRIGMFIGEKVEIGEVWSWESEFELPNGGKLLYDNIIHFSEWVEFDGRDCLQIEFEYVTDASEADSLVNNFTNSVIKAAGEEDFEIDNSISEISGGGMRIVDPNTMRIFYEFSVKEVKSLMTIPEMGEQTMTVIETREHQFNYLKE
jgi:hypothetical protein